ncbi:YhcH/YjgK/YiaL family protein [Foetidibacter luteolus]|uniref:YhcH/YjgK/YiaL family protein n=1 Tax=Foetidibacter luteolus TaxID=2608880 RepID=UPI00129BE74D|nr:YhcH/YjgK/YiaL family protein [Foetidibacter luteolus]
MIIDSLSNIEFYKSINRDIYEGLVFIKNASPDIELGSYPLTETAKALVMEYETKPENDFGYEAHKHVIDVQYCIKGTELIPWSNLKRLKAYTEYSEEKDVTFYEKKEEQGRVIIGNDIFAVFYPEDAHAPVYANGEPGYIKKIVIKVSV